MNKERKPNRLKGYDYSSDNLYFITSCVQNRICCFGEIQPHPREIILNAYGKIAENQWYWLADQYPYVVLHAFVVMPNHIHGIIEINRLWISIDSDRDVVGTGRDVVGTGLDPSLQHDKNVCKRTKIKSLSELIGAYKTTVSKQIHLMGFLEFQWQRSFYDRIIHDRKSYNNISHYIKTNPDRWEQDNLHI